MLTKTWHSAKTLIVIVAAAAALQTAPAMASGFAVTAPVSSQFVENGNAADGQLANAWGIVLSPTNPFWINDNGTGLSTLYNSTGAKLGLVVTIPPPAGQPGPWAPNGMVFNGTSDFTINVGGVSNPAAFIFSTEDGTIPAWAGGTTANLVVDRSHHHSVYKGLAEVSTASGNFLLATDFHNRAIDVFDAHFDLVATIDDFDVPHRYAPFGIANLGGTVYVTFAIQDPKKHDDVAGPGHGTVESMSTTGIPFFHRLVTYGELNSRGAGRQHRQASAACRACASGRSPRQRPCRRVEPEHLFHGGTKRRIQRPLRLD